MSIFIFLFYIGIINIIFGFLWKWVIALPAALVVTLLKIDVIGMRAVKLFGTYLLVSLTAILTLVALGDNPSGIALFFYPLIGAFIVYMGYISNYYNARKEAYQSHDFLLMERLDQDAAFEMILSIGAVVFYVISLFVPTLSNNLLLTVSFGAINWVYQIPIIGFLIGIGGVLFLAGIIFQGVFAFGFLVASIFGKFKDKEESPEVEVIKNEQR